MLLTAFANATQSRRNARLTRRYAALICFAALTTIAGGCRAPRANPVLPVASMFEADSVPEAFSTATAALMWPGASRSFEITPAGYLFNGAWELRIQPTAGRSLATPPRTIAYEQRWMPVAHWTRRSGSIRWDFEAAALPSPVSGDSGLFVSCLARASNLGPAAQTARLECSFGVANSACFTAWDMPAGTPSILEWAGGRKLAAGWTDATTNGADAKTSWTLAAGTAREQRFVLSAYPAPSQTLERWARTPHATRMKEARDYWTQTLSQGAQFKLADPELGSALRAALVVLLSCREVHAGRWSPVGGPFQYRDLWLRDAARAITALSVAGFTRESRDLAASLLRAQWPSGAFLTQRGQLDGTGQVLWTFEQAWLRPAPVDSITTTLHASLAAWRWCEEQRRLSRSTNRTIPGVLPVAEPHDNEQVMAQLVGNDAWAIAGYRSLARMLQAAHRDGEADSVSASQRAYLADFDAALSQARGNDIPPSWQGGGRDWGNLAVAWPCGVLHPSDSRCRHLAERVWRASGGVGRCAYGDPDSLHGYVGVDLGTWAMLAGEPSVTDSELHQLLLWRTASGGAAELFSQRTRDFGRNLPPHATSAAALVSLVRNAVVFDDGDTLLLTLGAPARWWSGSRIEHAPTRWGVLDLTFERHNGEATWQWTPVPVWTALTLPPETLLLEAPGAGLVAVPGARTVLAPPGTREARVKLAPRTGGSS